MDNEAGLIILASVAVIGLMIWLVVWLVMLPRKKLREYAEKRGMLFDENKNEGLEQKLTGLIKVTSLSAKGVLMQSGVSLALLNITRGGKQSVNDVALYFETPSQEKLIFSYLGNDVYVKMDGEFEFRKFIDLLWERKKGKEELMQNMTFVKLQNVVSQSSPAVNNFGFVVQDGQAVIAFENSAAGDFSEEQIDRLFDFARRMKQALEF